LGFGGFSAIGAVRVFAMAMRALAHQVDPRRSARRETVYNVFFVSPQGLLAPWFRAAV